MNAEQLEIYANNDRDLYRSVVQAVRDLRRAVDRAANGCAKANADWHDDPEGDPEGYAEMHAPADEQYNRQTRDDAIRSLVDYYLRELALHPEA